jgi:GxxExxY protein
VQLNNITGEVVDASMKVHTALGPGLLESAYLLFLSVELQKRGLKVVSEVPVKVVYEGVELSCAYRLDLLVNGCVVVELKAVKKLLPVHEAQLLSYLRLGKYPVGLLINFQEAHLRDGIRRFVNNLDPSAPSASLRPLR